MVSYLVSELLLVSMVVSGGLYATYHLLGEPETTIDCLPATYLMKRFTLRFLVGFGG